MTRSLPREDAQTFIDVVDEALDMPDLSPWAQNQCLRPLYRTCGTHALLPKAMKIPICYDRTSDVLYSGGYADVWKGKHCGQDVAVKVIRTFSNSDFGKVIGRFCKEAITWKTLRHPNVLPLIGVTMTEVKFAMISDWMANGNLNEFVEANPDADRLKLLGDTARGLIYIHERGVVHGDLKGANILIDQTRRARLADFGLLTVISDPENPLPSSSYAPGGTARWMSPECIFPQNFGVKTSRPSKPSDCYSLGMVIYETISGNPPFHEDRDLAVFVKVLAGERPHRELGFVNSLWYMLERCWMPQPSDRPSVENVLQCLETCSDWTEKGAEGNLGFDSAISSCAEQDTSGDSTPPVNQYSNLEVNGDSFTALPPPPPPQCGKRSLVVVQTLPVLSFLEVGKGKDGPRLGWNPASNPEKGWTRFRRG
ncbi:kinase-like domain-containing protein [Thelephora terrestris]|uniref:Kinase-like domain-containing protein n=1 Tax=Thelephora terrestris TaxID=56493 RepID=A0A9P6HNP5_9AGAM|nr:kinase-like domain-containing protein [Thelephora terrestris]